MKAFCMRLVTGVMSPIIFTYDSKTKSMKAQNYLEASHNWSEFVLDSSLLFPCLFEGILLFMSAIDWCPQ